MGLSFIFIATGDGVTWEDPTNWDQNNGTFPGQDGATDSADINGYAVSLNTSIPNCFIYANTAALTIADGVAVGAVTTFAGGQVLSGGSVSMNGDLFIDRDSASQAMIYDYTPITVTGFLTVTGTVTNNGTSFEDLDTTTISCGGGCNFGAYTSTNAPQGYGTNLYLSSSGPITIGSAQIATSVDGGFASSASVSISGTDIYINTITYNGNNAGTFQVEASGSLTLNSVVLSPMGVVADSTGGFNVWFPTVNFQAGSTVTLGDLTLGGNGIVNVTGTSITWTGKLDIGGGGTDFNFSQAVVPNTIVAQIKPGTNVNFVTHSYTGVYGKHYR